MSAAEAVAEAVTLLIRQADEDAEASLVIGDGRILFTLPDGTRGALFPRVEVEDGDGLLVCHPKSAAGPIIDELARALTGASVEIR